MEEEGRERGRRGRGREGGRRERDSRKKRGQLPKGNMVPQETMSRLSQVLHQAPLEPHHAVPGRSGARGAPH